MSTMHRRTFLQASLGTGVIALAAGAGLLTPTCVQAAAWPKAAFEGKSVDEILKDLYGSTSATPSNDIVIKAPIQAENGAVVPISVTTKLPNVEAIGILVEKNPQPLIASVQLTGAEGYFSARMKMGTTSDVRVYVKSGGKLHMASQQIKVTVGGCGG